MDDPMRLSSPEENDPDQFLNKAKRLVLDEIEEFEHIPEGEKFDLYIVWFSKTLQNWKALLSTSRPNGFYYEVTYNGEAQVAYVDTYVKVRNTPRYDHELRNISEPIGEITKIETTEEGVQVIGFFGSIA